MSTRWALKNFNNWRTEHNCRHPDERIGRAKALLDPQRNHKLILLLIAHPYVQFVRMQLLNSQCSYKETSAIVKLRN